MHASYSLARLAVLLVAAIHFAISAGEIFLWSRIYPRLKPFDFSPGEAAKVGPIVANAGLYNGFVAAGLLWSTIAGLAPRELPLFFLVCVTIAGIFGAVTLKAPKTLLLQTVPALIAAAMVWSATS